MDVLIALVAVGVGLVGAPLVFFWLWIKTSNQAWRERFEKWHPW